MKLQLRRRLVAVLLAAILGLAGFPAMAADNISVAVDGQNLELDVAPVIVDGRVLVPLRKIFEALGATVEWEQAAQKIVGKRGETTVELTVGSKDAKVNGMVVELSVPPQIVNGRTLVPVRFVSEALGEGVDWDAVARRVIVTRQPTTPAQLAARELVLRPADLPFPGWTVLEDEVKGIRSEGWHRYLARGDEKAAAPPLMEVTMARIGPGARFGVEKTGCLPNEEEIGRPEVGDIARACLRATAGGGKEVVIYAAWKDWIIQVMVETDPYVDQAAAREIAMALVQHQVTVAAKLAEGQPRPAAPAPSAALTAKLAEVDRRVEAALAAKPQAPPAPPAIPAGQPAVVAATLRILERKNVPMKFQFADPGRVPDAPLGKVYTFSFCTPGVSAFSTLCGWPEASNPLGGRPPYEFRTEGGFPPQGLHLLNNGLLTGTPAPETAGKQYDFRVCAYDLAGASACRDASVYIGDPFDFPDVGDMPAAQIGQSYRHSFCSPAPAGAQAPCGQVTGMNSPVGGRLPYTFRITGGKLPEGLTLAANGLLTGTPAREAKSSTVTICAMDKVGTQVCQDVNLEIAPTSDRGKYENTSWKGDFLYSPKGILGPTYNGTFTFRFGTWQAENQLIPITEATITYRGLPYTYRPGSGQLYCFNSRPTCNDFNISYSLPIGFAYASAGVDSSEWIIMFNINVFGDFTLTPAEMKGRVINTAGGEGTFIAKPVQ